MKITISAVRSVILARKGPIVLTVDAPNANLESKTTRIWVNN